MPARDPRAFSRLSVAVLAAVLMGVAGAVEAFAAEPQPARSGRPVSLGPAPRRTVGAVAPPSGTFYDPENDGSPLTSLGVHEHWNNAIDKQYARNLGTGSGIELVPGDPPATLDLVVRSTPISGIPIQGSPAGCGGTTDYLVHPDAGTEVTLTAPASWEDGEALYRFVRWTLDGVNQLGGHRELAFTCSDDTEAVAVYSNRPFEYVWGKAYHVLPETHSDESGYFSLCEGLNAKIYVGTAKYQVNSYLVEFDPVTEQQRIVIDVHDLCGLEASGYAAQAKIHTRNDVGESGKIYVGSKQGYREPGDTQDYPGGYAMTYDPSTDQGENLGMPYPTQGIIDTVSDEAMGLLYVVTCEEQHWMKYDMGAQTYEELGPILTPYAATLVDSLHRANALTEDFKLAQYDPLTGEITIRDILVDGELFVHADSYSIPTWRIARDGRTAYLVLLNDPTLIEIDLLSEGDTVTATSHGLMLEGNNPDCRCGLDIDLDGCVYVVVRVDNDTGFGGGYLHHLTRFDPATDQVDDLGVIAVENPDFFDWGPPAPPWSHGYHTLPDGTLTPLYHHMALIAASDGTIYITIIYPFTLLRIGNVFETTHTLSVRSVPITGIPIDSDPDSCDGTTPYSVECGDQEVVALTAPAEFAGREFLHWEDGSGQVIGLETSIDVLMDADKTVVAVYESLLVEHGTVWAGHGWTTVNLTELFTDPIVVAGPATSIGWQPGVVRLRNVTPTSFQVKFQEWDYLDGVHVPEHIHWIAVERGTYDLGGGKRLIADSFVTNKTSVLYPKWVSFPDPFSETPVVLTQVQTFNGADAVTDRICGVYPGGMHFSMQEQESKTGHCNETIGYIAVSAGATDLLGVACDVRRTAAVVTHNPYMLAGSEGHAVVRVREEQSKDAETLHWAGEKVGFISLAGQPVVIADMQTCNGSDPCELRCTLLSQVLAEEDGVVSANHQWKTVSLAGTYVDPVVLAGPATYTGKAPGEIRVRSVTKTSFQIRFQEWDYLDGWHCYEQIHWMVVERGAWDIGGGDIWIADEFLTKNANVHSPSWVTLPLALTSADFVLATQQTANGASCVTERISNVGATGFNVALQEEEAADAIHTEENVGYFASGTGTGGLSAEGVAVPAGVRTLRAGASGVSPTAEWHIYIVEEQSKDAETSHGWEGTAGLVFGGTPSGQPPYILDMQTCNGVDPCSLRCEYGVTAGGSTGKAQRPRALGAAGAGLYSLLVGARSEDGSDLSAVEIAVGQAVAEGLPLERAYRPGETVTLSAPASITDGAGLLVFSHWEVDGQSAEAGQATIRVEITGDREAVTVYVSSDAR